MKKITLFHKCSYMLAVWQGTRYASHQVGQTQTGLRPWASVVVDLGGEHDDSRVLHLAPRFRILLGRGIDGRGDWR